MNPQPPKPFNKHCDLTYIGKKCPKCGTLVCSNTINTDKANIPKEKRGYGRSYGYPTLSVHKANGDADKSNLPELGFEASPSSEASP